jgi:uncharacterized protein
MTAADPSANNDQKGMPLTTESGPVRVSCDPTLFRVQAADEDRPRLLGSFSPASGLSFWPPRHRCPVTGTDVTAVELSTTGRLYAWTFLYLTRMGSISYGAAGGYGVGQIDLPEGVRVQAPLRGTREDWSIGALMGLTYLPVGTADDGAELVTLQFEAVTL